MASTGTIVGVAIFLLLVLTGLIVAAYFLYKHFFDGGGSQITVNCQDPANSNNPKCIPPPNFPKNAQNYAITMNQGTPTVGIDVSLSTANGGSNQNGVTFQSSNYKQNTDQQWQFGFLQTINDGANAIYVISPASDPQNQFLALDYQANGDPNGIACNISIQGAPSDITNQEPAYNYFWVLTPVSPANPTWFSISPLNFPCYNLIGGSWTSSTIPIPGGWVLSMASPNNTDLSQIFSIDPI